MKSSFEELLRDLQIISKELFLSSWNLVSTTNLNTAFAFGGGFLVESPPFGYGVCRDMECWRGRFGWGFAALFRNAVLLGNG